MVYHPIGHFYRELSKTCILPSFTGKGHPFALAAQVVYPSTYDSEWAMLALPIRLGDLGIFDPCKSEESY